MPTTGGAIVCGFDPRSRTGSDRRHQHVEDAVFEVSIRAPARGATRKGVTGSVSARFRSALPHGERLAAIANHQMTTCFDPRSRTGSDS
jgi:hypothetical protein